jgi:SAM-dependent methyltransferase
MWDGLHAKGYPGYSFNASANLILSHLPEGWVKPEMRAVEIGCGRGDFMKSLAPYFYEVYGCDISLEAIDLAWKFLADVPNTYPTGCDGATLPFSDKLADLVYEFALFQHLPRALTLGYLKEAGRVVKPDGLIFAQFITRRDPKGNLGDIDKPEKEETIGWDAEQLRRLVSDAGLKLLRLDDNSATMFNRNNVYWSFVLAEPSREQVG